VLNSGLDENADDDSSTDRIADQLGF
jgi:hypothetical protein